MPKTAKSIGAKMKKFLLVLTIGIALCSAVAHLYVNPPSVTGVAPGGNFTVSVMISDAVDVYSYQAELSFNNAVLSTNESYITQGTFLRQGGYNTFFGTYQGGSNVIEAYETRLGDVPGANGNGTLWSVRFDVIAYGSSPISFVPGNTILCDHNVVQLPYTYTNGFFSNQVGIQEGEEKTNGKMRWGDISNPVNKFLEFEYYLPIPGVVKVSIYDISGKEVKMLSEKFEQKGWISVKEHLELADGIYFLKADSQKEGLASKIVVIH